MKIFLDTNILVSAAMFPNGAASKAYFKAITLPNDVIITEYVVDEFINTIKLKFSKKDDLAKVFINLAKDVINLLENTDKKVKEEELIKDRDNDDILILRSAINYKCDLLITGDKDLLDIKNKVKRVKIVSPREFIDKY